MKLKRFQSLDFVSLGRTVGTATSLGLLNILNFYPEQESWKNPRIDHHDFLFVYTYGDSDVISSYQLFSGILWGKL